MTIHSSHPFQDPESERDPARRFRSRLGGAVSLWTSGADRERAGLTVSSLVVATGEPAEVVALLDPDSDLAERLQETGRGVVHLLRWQHRDLADAFAGVAPAPGGPFTLGQWHASEWGPVLDSATTWVGVGLADVDEVGWSLLVRCVVESAEIGAEPDPLVHRRGRYQAPS
ncbi:flavin reductase family protein [Nocardioides donggukensis]|uniref:Flavin reductase n=1 Tax=Nocardioides donggukensis TaxID=2774019 RepID=A0A927K2B5_9ACTN|nr:flavin reductase family protein [Nocardioides donggukensis]MBD8869172.1 flavin reductase [Nocardioides donggukensis]